MIEFPLLTAEELKKARELGEEHIAAKWAIQVDPKCKCSTWQLMAALVLHYQAQPEGKK